MTSFYQRMRGYVAMTIGFLACPCHLVWILPLLLVATAVPAVGIWLEGHQTWLYALGTLLFLGGIGLGWLWLQSPTCDVDDQHHHNTRSFER
ncbi:MAG: hypothetical protein HY326_09100 [Chloroflexi bacterium]|nr:hypothetical protein [Chloroflexota bacterium]